ncbi:MAG TPA: calcium-binding protein [Solirubrobacteraceae bacterium]|nr:calcium-binding protein [Solirubrobacteraceae bacterium]
MKAALLPISLLLAVSLPTAALAAPTAEYSNGTLTVTGDAAVETFTVIQEGSYVTVKGPSGMNDPDGNPDDVTCAAFDERVRCADSVVNNVVVNGGAGGDSISDERGVTQDTDTLNGNDGDDTLTGPAGGALLLMNMNGGAGDDTLIRNRHGIFLVTQGGPGDDTLMAGADGSLGESDHGEAGDDTYVGSATAVDRFVADPGADTYRGGSGDAYRDSMSYGEVVAPVTLTLDGRPNDGEAGERDNVMPDIELIFGGAAADHLTAGGVPAELYGGAGDDRLAGGPGADGLNGEAGHDVLLGGGGDDRLLDGDETPEIENPQQPPAGNDRLDGGAGNDTFESGRGADDLHGGAGYDFALFFRWIPRPPTAPPPSRAASFAISLDDRANDGQRGTTEGDNVHTDVEEVNTWDGDDVLTGSAGPDTLFSSEGNDRIDAGAGVDSVWAGGGDDVVMSVDGATDRVDCQGGTDRLDADLPGAEPDRADVAFNCETVTGTPLPSPHGESRAPRLVLKGLGSRMTRRAFNRGVKVRVGADEPVAAEITLRIGRRTVAGASLRRVDGVRTVRLTPASRVRGRRAVRARVRVVAFDAAGNRAVKMRSFLVSGRRR